jgi:hypothetical protein
MPKLPGDKPRHAKPPRGATQAEKAKAKAKDTGERAKFRDAANREADKVQAEQDRAKQERDKHS